MQQKPKQGMGLHQWIAAGGKPKDYQGTKGINANTINGK